MGTQTILYVANMLRCGNSFWIVRMYDKRRLFFFISLYHFRSFSAAMVSMRLPFNLNVNVPINSLPCLAFPYHYGWWLRFRVHCISLTLLSLVPRNRTLDISSGISIKWTTSNKLLLLSIFHFFFSGSCHFPLWKGKLFTYSNWTGNFPYKHNLRIKESAFCRIWFWLYFVKVQCRNGIWFSERKNRQIACKSNVTQGHLDLVIVDTVKSGCKRFRGREREPEIGKIEFQSVKRVKKK